jgi:hypothetical protein
MQEKEIPHREVCDRVFRKDLLPAVYRWVSALSPAGLTRFERVFPRIARAIVDPSSISTDNSTTSSYSSMPEWSLFQGSAPPSVDLSPETLLSRPTSSHLTYGAFSADQMRACRGVPTRTRENDRSQIHTAERCGANMERWTERAMNTTYRKDICHAPVEGGVKNCTEEQMAIVYSRGTLSEEAVSAVAPMIGRDGGWTREFRELCRALAEAADATDYRAGFTGVKVAPPATHTRQKWTDPVPVSHGLARAAETFWQTSNRADFVPVTRPVESYRPADQRKAEMETPFDRHPGAEKMISATREAFRDHTAERDDHPEYYSDARVRIGGASAVAGRVTGRRM